MRNVLAAALEFVGAAMVVGGVAWLSPAAAVALVGATLFVVGLRSER